VKILFVSRFLPHSDVRDSGGQDTYHTIADLGQRHDVTLIAFATSEQGRAVAAMKVICREVFTVPYHPKNLLHRLWRKWWRVWLPLVYGTNVSIRFGRRLRNLLASDDFDVVIVDGMMAQYGSIIRQTKKLLDEIDIYSTVAYQMYAKESRPLPRLFKAFDWLRTQIFELRYARSYNGLLVRSEKDRVLLGEYLPEQRINILKPWFEGLADLHSIPTQRPSGNSLLFMGAMNHSKNVEAVLHFANKVLPLIHLQVPDATFNIVGNAPVRQVLELDRRPDVFVSGEVASLKPFYEQCVVNVVPLLVGGGVIVKTLNGMAAARPTVATRFGVAGIGARDGRDLLIVSSEPRDFAAAVTRLLTNNATWMAIAGNGRQFVQQNYNWQENIKALEEFLASVIRS